MRVGDRIQTTHGYTQDGKLITHIQTQSHHIYIELSRSNYF